MSLLRLVLSKNKVQSSASKEISKEFAASWSLRHLDFWLKAAWPATNARGKLPCSLCLLAAFLCSAAGKTTQQIISSSQQASRVVLQTLWAFGSTNQGSAPAKDRRHLPLIAPVYCGPAGPSCHSCPRKLLLIDSTHLWLCTAPFLALTTL